jgi:hypothetical protein
MVGFLVGVCGVEWVVCGVWGGVGCVWCVGCVGWSILVIWY